MKLRPILFSGPMVRALLDGTKTQTRRIAPIRDLNIISHPGDMVTWAVSFLKAVKGVLGSHSGGKFSELQARSIIASQFNPYGQPGDRLWVREAWRTVAGADNIPPSDLMNVESFTHYEADETKPAGMGKLRPSIHMPRWASRITLEIVSVRVERLTEISEADAVAEGSFTWAGEQDTPVRDLPEARLVFRQLWESINGLGSWDANPWVWCVEFRRIKP